MAEISWALRGRAGGGQACSLLLLAAVIPVGSGFAAAQTNDSTGNQVLNTILPPVAGQRVCFARKYDEIHLQQHPQQKVTEIVFDLEYVRNPQRYDFGISAKLRSRSDRLYAFGTCETNVAPNYPGGNACVVACDGGGVSLEKVKNADAIYVHLQTPSEGIAMRPSGHSSCGAEQGLRLEAGTDDRVFRLDSAPMPVCQSLHRMLPERR
ncbi:hypothetical protein ACFFWD_36575 [Bradyrhizobium erythrophlei]|uniref:hypothetical protein n=1 Tax=Bradyrhizobium erythrophlei TaxID=1437360 RepID=UPI0035E708CD